jgi:hypothetical protein
MTNDRKVIPVYDGVISKKLLGNTININIIISPNLKLKFSAFLFSGMQLGVFNLWHPIWHHNESNYHTGVFEKLWGWLAIRNVLLVVSDSWGGKGRLRCSLSSSRTAQVQACDDRIQTAACARFFSACFYRGRESDRVVPWQRLAMFRCRDRKHCSMNSSMSSLPRQWRSFTQSTASPWRIRTRWCRLRCSWVSKRTSVRINLRLRLD